jgi:hypothetical protein
MKTFFGAFIYKFAPLRPAQHLLVYAIGFMVCGCSSFQDTSGIFRQPGTTIGQEVWAEHVLPIQIPNRGVTQIAVHTAYGKDLKRGPAILFIPGGGNISRFGARSDNGVTSYATPIDVTGSLMSVATEHGFLAMAWDKRSCKPSDDTRCLDADHQDVLEDGPRALRHDLQAACEAIIAHPRFDGRLVLWGHGQAGQIALDHSCTAKAAAIVLAAPIPRRVDRVLVDALYHRSKESFTAAKKLAARKTNPKEELRLRRTGLALKNKASSLAATFTALTEGRFASDAKIWGYGATYWTNWIQWTDAVPGKNPEPLRPWLVALGQYDTQFSPRDRQLLRQWGKHDDITFMEIPQADHHLLVNEKMRSKGIQQLFKALLALLVEKDAI